MEGIHLRHMADNDRAADIQRFDLVGPKVLRCVGIEEAGVFVTLINPVKLPPLPPETRLLVNGESQSGTSIAAQGHLLH